MQKFVLPLLAVGSMCLMTACTTKVYNQTPPAVGHTTVIEKERPVPVVTEREPAHVDVHMNQPQPRAPEVNNNIRVER
jgi:hypothetical protein